MIPLPALAALKALPWRLIGYGALLAGLIIAGLWYRHSLIAAGEATGRAQVRALWEEDTAKRNAADAKAIAAAQKAKDEAIARNGEIENEYQAKVAAAAADRDSNYRLLQQARNQVRAVTAREGTSAVIAATAGEASIADRIDRATAGLIEESRANADQLDALIAVVKPQM